MHTFIQKHRLFVIAVALLWLKMYIVHRFFFDLQVENILQEILVFINSASSILILCGVSLLFSANIRNKIIIGLSVLTSIILFANLVYYRFFSDFITLSVLFQTNNASDLGSSILTLIHPADIFLFTDIIVLIIIAKLFDNQENRVSKKQIVSIFAVGIVMFAFNLGLSEIDRPQLLTRSFDRTMIIKNIGILNYHVYDMTLQSKVSAQKVFAESGKINEVEAFVKEVKTEPNHAFRGMAKGKNVFVISLESTQSFVLNRSVEGKEITPFLNQLINESYYFPNFYHQTGQGKTSDAEFLVDNSLYPLPSGAVFFTHAQNEYNGLPEIISEEGYYSVVFHPNNKTFWNRDAMYDSLGYDDFFSESDFDIDESNSVGWGLKDEEMFKQSIEHLKTLPEPYYVKYITLTNHFPFELDEEDQYIPEWTSNSETVNRYFTTVRYTDEAVKSFFQKLKEEGIYEKSVFILYGDHYGISANHNEAMSEFLGEEITPFQQVQLQRVPMLIHIPGEEGETIETIGGQIDLKPTILNLLGIDPGEDIEFGSDLFSRDRAELTVLRDGSFITKNYVYTKNKCYEKQNGSEVNIDNCEPFMKKAELQLDYSDQIIYGDLLRFYNEKED